MQNIIVPALGESVTEAIIARWMKKEGEIVQTDEPIVELETDKVTLEVTAPISGMLNGIQAKEGDTVSVGAILGKVDGSAEATPVSKEKKEKSSPVTAPPSTKLPPSVERLVSEHQLDLDKVSGTGKSGRVTKSDVIDHIQTGPRHEPSFGTVSSASLPPFQSGFSVPDPQASENRVKMSRLRQKISERLKEAQNTAAILTTFNEVDISSVMELRQIYKDSFEKKYGSRLGFMSFFVRAVVQALKEIPIVNARIEGDEIVYNQFYDVGVAVSAPQGLVVPVIRQADRLSFSEIERTITEMGLKAKDNKLSIQELTGGTFTISNGGVFGSLVSTPIINPPQSAILGMHKIQERPVVIKGQVVARPMMYLALSYDHRLIDGREAVTFLVRIKEMIEAPERLMLEI